jgi:hypothetical protein
MGEHHGLDVDKESYPRLLTLTEWQGYADLLPLEFTKNNSSCAVRVAQVVECLLSKLEALNSKPQYTKK